MKKTCIALIFMHKMVYDSLSPFLFFEFQKGSGLEIRNRRKLRDVFRIDRRSVPVLFRDLMWMGL
jgi:hypothetical protein